MSACSEMLGHMSMIREFVAHFDGLIPGIAGSEGCEGLFTNPKTEKVATEEFSFQHVLAFQQALVLMGLANVYWPPGLGSRNDGLTKTKSDVAPLLHLLESGTYSPGALRPLQGVASCGR